MNKLSLTVQGICIILFFFSMELTSQESSSIGSASYLYRRAALDYDTAGLKQVLSMLRDSKTQDSYSHFFLKGLCLLRLQIIAYAAENKVLTESLGKEAEVAFDSALIHSNTPFNALAYQTFVYQLIASTGFKNGAIYGPRLSRQLELLKKNNPGHIYTRLAEAVNILQAPKFAGGNPKKAEKLLETLAADYPDSAFVWVHLGTAYLRSGYIEKVCSSANSVLKLEPANPLGLKLLKECKKK